MGHIKFDKGSKGKRNFNGFYLALAVCLVAVGGVAIATFYKSTTGIKPKPTDIINRITTEKRINPTQPVGKVVTDVPKDNTTPTTIKAPDSTTIAKAADLFILPLSNEIICEYSNNKPVYSKTMNDWRVHNGVDFKGTKGQSVKALADGEIVSINKKDVLWGAIVVINHGYGIESRYCGVTVSSLKEGDTVKVGDAIGSLSDIPCESAEGPHLHIEILTNDEYVNPVEAIGREVKYSTGITSTIKK
ncbi:MAG: M23 family metallopeptidase [Oscillospiraceae bacterium]|nr:M23 family metallopeptidase [Oscillospiraceae bacterium]MDD4413923.1 M23 family metallopeptidase [Oscillospiraceae bacterium]